MVPTTEQPDGDPGARRYTSDVQVVKAGNREFILVGTAHISQESVDLVREVIEKEEPDCVCIELDARRYETLSQERRWEQLDLRQIIRGKQLTTLIANLLLASYQKRLGGKLGVTPGRELLEAARTAEELDIPISLCDRDIRVTLRRAWGSLSLYRKAQLISNFAVSAFEAPELSEDELRRIRQKDVLTELMQELGEAMPTLKRTLIDERDRFLAQKIRDSEGERIVAVVGAGHLAGMTEALRTEREEDLEEINTIPPISPVWKWVGWGVPALIIGALVYIGFTKGSSEAGESALFWFLANAIPTGIGGLVALAHPITIAAAFLCAPFTSLTPVIGAGYVAAGVQAYVRPPRVHEFQSVGDDIAQLVGWWRNRLLKIFLTFGLTTVGSLTGTWVGGIEIVRNML